MDDKKVFELKRLELAYCRQLIYMCGVISVALIGLILYIINIYRYNFQLFLVAVMLIVVGVISIFNIDSNMKEISKKIKGM
jgi:ABC-type bacteriocin/lantibiotic exporter with double-glycine peptidase domain